MCLVIDLLPKLDSAVISRGLSVMSAGGLGARNLGPGVELSVARSLGLCGQESIGGRRPQPARRTTHGGLAPQRFLDRARGPRHL